MAVRFKSAAGVRKWLEDRTAIEAAALAARAAARVLPLIAEQAEGAFASAPQHTNPAILANFRATFCAIFAAKCPHLAAEIQEAVGVSAGAGSRANQNEAAVCAARSADWAARYEIALKPGMAVEARNYAGAAAQSAAEIAGRADRETVRGAFDAALYASAAIEGSDAAKAGRAAAAAVKIAGGADASWNETRRDGEALLKNGANALLCMPLWANGAPPFFAHAWLRLKAYLAGFPDWKPWIDGYEALLAARPRWPELSAERSQALEIQIACLDYGLWNDAAQTNRRIAQLVSESIARSA